MAAGGSPSHWRAAHDPVVRGAVEHLLVLARRPRWKAVLKQIVQTLDAAGVCYTLTGGTVAALHIPGTKVKDIDLLMEREGVYRMQELFPAQLTDAVRYQASSAYRSHFGRFDFDGVPVEVMADLERREGEGWAPTGSATEAWVDLEGVRVRAAWLEEETLAYIRRGRLQRAALLLPHCDPGRLLALLRHEVQSPVL